MRGSCGGSSDLEIVIFVALADVNSARSVLFFSFLFLRLDFTAVLLRGGAGCQIYIYVCGDRRTDRVVSSMESRVNWSSLALTSIVHFKDNACAKSSINQPAFD